MSWSPYPMSMKRSFVKGTVTTLRATKASTYEWSPNPAAALPVRPRCSLGHGDVHAGEDRATGVAYTFCATCAST